MMIILADMESEEGWSLCILSVGLRIQAGYDAVFVKSPRDLSTPSLSLQPHGLTPCLLE